MSASRSRRTLVALTLVGAAGAASVALSPGAATAHPGAHDRDGAGKAVAELRRAIQPYQDVDRALAHGFLPTTECVDLSGVGGMGLHYVNPARLMAPPDPAKPSILLYQRDSDGELELLGAEFFAADRDQDLRTTDDRPSMFGQPFDGPMPGHEPGMPVHYDLHVWVGQTNPTGVFAPWNPKVSCSS